MYNMKLSCFWHVQRYISDRYQFMSIEEQSIWSSNLELIHNQLMDAYNKGLTESPVKYLLSSSDCECSGCVDISDKVH